MRHTALIGHVCVHGSLNGTYGTRGFDPVCSCVCADKNRGLGEVASLSFACNQRPQGDRAGRYCAETGKEREGSRFPGCAGVASIPSRGHFRSQTRASKKRRKDKIPADSIGFFCLHDEGVPRGRRLPGMPPANRRLSTGTACGQGCPQAGFDGLFAEGKRRASCDER